MKTLASDEFAGRAPGSIGEEKTVAWLESEFRRIGLKPGNGDSYFQTVPMVETTADESTTMQLQVAGKPRQLAFGSEMVIGTRSGKTDVAISDSDLVFVGYGVNAPELGWNDYAGVDVKGKTVVMFINDPGFHTNDADLFEGKRMTYYGRWTYKFEEAARQGAAAALIIHDTDGASYGWDVVKNSWSGPQFDLAPADDPEPRLPAQGWISTDVARSVLTDLGQNLDALYAAANKTGFKAIPLEASMSVDLKSTVNNKSSQNVMALLPGKTRPDEAIIYMAHWDHLGDHAEEGAPASDLAVDTIYNGAIDNATGTAALIEIGRAFAQAKTKPERSLVFLNVTAEEKGLLGSEYYASKPLYPLGKTVAVLNMDALDPHGPARDFTTSGSAKVGLLDDLVETAKRWGLAYSTDSKPEAGYFFRSDHFPFAKRGVPAVSFGSGEELVDGGVAAGKAISDAYTADRYHQPADQWEASWSFTGMARDLQLLYTVGNELANSDRWPNWSEDSEFRAARDATAADRK